MGGRGAKDVEQAMRIHSHGTEPIHLNISPLSVGPASQLCIHALHQRTARLQVRVDLLEQFRIHFGS